LDQSIILRQEANNLPNNFPVLERAAMVKALGTLQGGGLPVAGDGFGVGERDNLVLPVVDDEAGDGQLGDGRFHNHRFQGKADPVYQFLAHFFNSGGRYAQEAGGWKTGCGVARSGLSWESDSQRQTTPSI
jgi:hypothetical protein